MPISFIYALMAWIVIKTLEQSSITPAGKSAPRQKVRR